MYGLWVWVVGVIVVCWSLGGSMLYLDGLGLRLPSSKEELRIDGDKVHVCLKGTCENGLDCVCGRVGGCACGWLELAGSISEEIRIDEYVVRVERQESRVPSPGVRGGLVSFD